MASPNPILVRTTRGETTESFHRGVVCVVDERGEILLSVGDVKQVCFPRSAIKFMQVLPLIESGAADRFGITSEELAVICASHNGEPVHVERVQALLARLGLSEASLGCGAHSPTHSESNIKLIQSGSRPSQLHNNCSGKHTGFLALALHLGAPLDSYLHPDHPVQKMVRACLADLCEVTEDSFLVGTDGCSAPNFAMPVIQQAIGFRNLGMARGNPVRDAACRRVLDALAAHPHMVAGTGRYCTELIERTKGRVIGKLGADGVYCMSIPERKMGIAIKIDDGSTGPQYNVAQAVLSRLGILDAETQGAMAKWHRTPIQNFKKILTGYREVVGELA